MNPTQTRCKYTNKYNLGGYVYHELPKVGGVELRIHKPDGKECHYFCKIDHMMKWIKQQNSIITDDMVDGD